jgi:hypothetical protein
MQTCVCVYFFSERNDELGEVLTDDMKRNIDLHFQVLRVLCVFSNVYFDKTQAIRNNNVHF